MAFTKKEAAEKVISLLNAINIKLGTAEREKIIIDNILNYFGSECKIVNMRSPNRCGIKVNTKWFENDRNLEKPSYTSSDSGNTYEPEYFLIPTENKLLGINYLQLRECCLELEREKNKWFHSSTWGMDINPGTETFKWTGGNEKVFNLDCIKSKDFIALPEIRPAQPTITSPPDIEHSFFKRIYEIVKRFIMGKAL